MKILKDNYNVTTIDKAIERAKLYPRKLVCDVCSSELEYEEEDLRMGEYGCMHLDCPLCGEDNMLDPHEKNITLTKDNIQFPLHFHHVCEENGAVDCCNQEYFKEYLNKAIAYFRQHKDEYSWGGHITGNLYLCVRRYEGDETYDVTVSRDFYTMDIPFEREDY